MPTKTYLIPKSNLKVFEQGNIFKWYAIQQKLEPGKRYNLRGKVKGHKIVNVYKNQNKHLYL